MSSGPARRIERPHEGRLEWGVSRTRSPPAPQVLAGIMKRIHKKATVVNVEV